MTETTPETARLTADTVLFGTDQGGDLHVLLILRRWDPFEGCWALPGGHVDPGEETLSAAWRELEEETGLVAGRLDFVRAYAAPRRDPRGRYVTFAYTAHLRNCPDPTAADDAAQARWFPVDEALAAGFPLAFDHRSIVLDALRQVP